MATEGMPEEVVWTEKYRPTSIEECVGNTKVRDTLDASVHVKPSDEANLLLTGPPGVGKTACVQGFARKMAQDDEKWLKKLVMEMDVTDDCGFDKVKTVVENFARQAVGTLPDGKYKLLVFDEVDSMPVEAQQVLSYVMKDHSNTTRFVLTSKRPSQVIEPIKTLCTILEFSKITKEEMESRLKMVLEKEGVTYDAGGIKDLLLFAEGDMRQALNYAQACHVTFNEVSKETLSVVCNQPHPDTIKRALNLCIQNQNYQALEIFEAIFDNGHTIVQIIAMIHRVLKTDTEIPDHLKLEFFNVIAEFNRQARDHDCASTPQLAAMISGFCRGAQEQK